jgi:hypothetical protein
MLIFQGGGNFAFTKLNKKIFSTKKKNCFLQETIIHKKLHYRCFFYNLQSENYQSNISTNEKVNVYPVVMDIIVQAFSILMLNCRVDI